MSEYSVIVWDNDGIRSEMPAGDAIAQAKAVAKTQRTLSNRTVKIGRAGNSILHWSMSTHLDRNHWSQLATADEWFV